MSQLARLSGTLPGQLQDTWELNHFPFIIGRQAPADLVIPARRISRQHAQIEQRPSGYYLVDLGSTNGTYLNGAEVEPAGRRLAGGDEIVFGGIVRLNFVDPEATVDGPRIGRLHGIWLDAATTSVWIDGKVMTPPLSPAQWTLLRLLYDAGGRIISRDRLIAAVWPDADRAGVSGEAVDGLIKRLRSRLRPLSGPHEYIDVRRGHGVCLTQRDD